MTTGTEGGLIAPPLTPIAEAPLKVDSVQVLGDEILTQHVHHALSLGLPSLPHHPTHDLVAVLVASGASVTTQLDSIKRQRDKGRPIIAIKDAHDWLISEGIIPNQAIVLDPTEHQWQCFRRKHPDVQYWVSSQCHPKMFEHLHGHQVSLFHLIFNNNAAYKGKGVKFMIGGGTTTGLRAISLLYVLGFRRFELYGYDSCLMNGHLRVETAWERPKDANSQLVTVRCGSRRFICNFGMAAQANEFLNLWTDYKMPDIFVQSYGDGLITAILEEWTQQSMDHTMKGDSHADTGTRCLVA